MLATLISKLHQKTYSGHDRVSSCNVEATAKFN